VKRWHISFTDTWYPAPLSFWVHHPVDGRVWYASKAFEPPLPGPVPGRGYPRYLVEVDGFTFVFASLAELDTCLEVLGQRMLPSTERETIVRHVGPGFHWLNKLPGSVKSWRYREEALKTLRQARADFVREITH
jgi:hypothetical protein